jgi:hypothetical protein
MVMLISCDDKEFKEEWMTFMDKDPVHPAIPVDIRVKNNRKVFALIEDDQPQALICAKISNRLERSMNEILQDGEESTYGIFYSVFRLKGAIPGAGRQIIFDTIKYVRSQGISNTYTLSPIPSLKKQFKTIPPKDKLYEFLMSREDPVSKFHLGNGAEIDKINYDADDSEIRQNESFGIMVNYRYGI